MNTPDTRDNYLYMHMTRYTNSNSYKNGLDKISDSNLFSNMESRLNNGLKGKDLQTSPSKRENENNISFDLISKASQLENRLE